MVGEMLDLESLAYVSHILQLETLVVSESFHVCVQP